ncbi:MAG: hypothetical protein A4S09_05805 [Proteobacteria bacterium SG_bin7]|nr:MAG: hypothetical protein A4S09_05805 [Proteobacteria bacterium SG_bin7]
MRLDFGPGELAQVAKTFDEVVSIFSPWSEGGAAKFSDTTLFSSDDFRTIWHRIPQRKVESDMMAAKLVAQRIDEYKAVGGLVVVE